MASSTSVLQPIIILVAVLLQTGECIKCYQCHTETNYGKCGTAFQNDVGLKKDCGPKHTACYELTHKRHYYTDRSCGDTHVCDHPDKDIDERCRSCTTNYCNDQVVPQTLW